MKPHVSRLLGFLLPAMLIAGCTETVNTHGQVILPSRLAQIKVGQTTRDDILQLLGSPSTEGTLNDNRWYYVTSTVGTKTFNPYQLKDRKVVIIDFDPSGTVANMTQKGAADGKEVMPSDKSTPTHGQSMGLVDQFFDNIGGIIKK